MKEKKILLVEDNFLNRRVTRKALTENGYIIFEAKNAREALELLKKESIDLCILDINLGENELDGMSLSQQIKEKFDIPFIYLTAYDDPEVINKAVATRPYSFLTKPFKNADLIASVEVSIRQSAHLHRYKPSILVKDEDYNLELPIDEINYIESEGNYLFFHTDKKTYKCRSTVKQVLEKLPENIFVQVHRAYVINKTRVEKFSPKSMMIRNKEIPVSKNYMESH